MHEHFISLPENVYCYLLAVAETQGMTPADWIASQLALNTQQHTPVTSSLSGLIGAINSQVEPPPTYEKTVLGEAIANKLAKQGIRRP